MKRLIFTIAFIAVLSAGYAQKEVNAIVEFEEAENAFNENRFEETIKRLNDAEKNLGNWTPKTSYLKILALDKLCDYNEYKNEYTQAQINEIKLYMNYANQNSESIIEEKFKTIYQIQEKTNYTIKLNDFRLMPEYIAGKEAFDKKDYSSGLSLWTKAADKDNWIAMSRISYLYLIGLGVQQNYQSAFEWHAKAAQKGYLYSIAQIGLMYLNGQGVSQNFNLAKEKLVFASEQGSTYAMYQLANMYANGTGLLKKDYKSALYWFKKVSAKTDLYSDSNYMIGYIYFSGFEVDQSYSEAIKWFQKGDLKGSLDSTCYLGYMYANGVGVNQDYNEALKYYQKGVDKNYPLALNNLGIMYYKGEGVSKDYTIAMKLLTKAADKGYTTAMQAVAEMYKNGWGVKKDKKLAAEWKAKADVAKSKE